MSGIEILLGTLYIAGTVRAAITTVREAKNFSQWIKKRQIERRRKNEEWNFISTCNDDFVIVNNDKGL